MDGKIYIKPGEGMSIPDPDTWEDIGPEGAWVPDEAFYRRYVLRGEAEATDPPRKARAASNKEKG